mgnify:CR=1 FL=1
MLIDLVALVRTLHSTLLTARRTALLLSRLWRYLSLCTLLNGLQMIAHFLKPGRAALSVTYSLPATWSYGHLDCCNSTPHPLGVPPPARSAGGLCCGEDSCSLQMDWSNPALNLSKLAQHPPARCAHTTAPCAPPPPPPWARSAGVLRCGRTVERNAGSSMPPPLPPAR